MAALSYYSNWDTHEFNSSDISILPEELFSGFPDDSFCDLEPDCFLYPENSISLLPDYNLDGTHASETCRVLPEFDHFHCLECQKEQTYGPVLTNRLHDYPPEVIIPTVPEFSTGPVYNYGGGRSFKKVKKPPSSQSIAAKGRRTKISDRIQELRKLIPGSIKMTFAQMYEAGYMYIKYLQAQVAVLEFMSSYNQENGDFFESDDELQSLLQSPVIQEKLYSSGKCLVPHILVQELSRDHHQDMETQENHAIAMDFQIEMQF